MSDEWAAFETIGTPGTRSAEKTAAADEWGAYELIGKPKTTSESGKPTSETPKPSTKDVPVTVADLAQQAQTGIPLVGAFTDKAKAAADAAGAGVARALGVENIAPGPESHAGDFATRYAENLAREKAKGTEFAAAHPIIAPAAQIGGALATTAPLAATAAGARALGLAGETLPAQAAAGATSGATISAADAALRGEDPVRAAELGGVTGAAAPVVGRAIGGAYRAVRDVVAPPTVPQVPAASANFTGGPIRLTPGQATGDFERIANERNAARGGMGPEAQQIGGTFDAAQQAEIAAARENMGRAYDPYGQRTATSPVEAAADVGEAVRGQAAQSRQVYRGLYDEFGRLQGEFQPGAFGAIGDSIRTRLNAGTNPVVVDNVTTPYAARMLHDVEENVGNLRFQNQAAPPGTPPHPPTPVTIQEVDNARKRLVSMYGQTERGSADQRAARGVIQQFDQHVADALAAPGVYTGSARAPQALAEARAAFAQHQRAFRSQGAGDVVGQTIEKIVGRHQGQEATQNEIASWLFGNASGAGGTAVKVAQRLRGMLGADSSEWSGVRQGMLLHLTEAPAGVTEWGPQKIASRIGEFLNGRGSALSHVMYSPAERAELARYGQILRMTVPPQGAVNWSNTAPTLARIAHAAGRNVFGMLGLAVHGPAGAIAGHVVDRVGAAARARANTAAATQAFYGTPAGRLAQNAQQLGAPRVAALIARAATRPVIGAPAGQ